MRTLHIAAFQGRHPMWLPSPVSANSLLFTAATMLGAAMKLLRHNNLNDYTDLIRSVDLSVIRHPSFRALVTPDS